MNTSTLSKSVLALLSIKHFSFLGDDIIIKQRKRGIQEKPPLYLFNLSKMVYVSSLREIEENLFRFDVRNQKQLEYYTLKNENGSIKIEKTN